MVPWQEPTSIPDWLETDWVLSEFGRDRPRAQFAYIDFVRAGIGLPSIWEALRNRILGSDGFSEKVSRGMRGCGDLREAPRAQRRSLEKTLGDFEKVFDDRREALARSLSFRDYTLREIAAHFRVHCATVSRAVRRE